MYNDTQGAVQQCVWMDRPYCQCLPSYSHCQHNIWHCQHKPTIKCSYIQYVWTSNWTNSSNSYSDETLSGENSFMYQLQTFEEVVVGQIWPRLLQVIAFRRPINCPHTSSHSFELKSHIDPIICHKLSMHFPSLRTGGICVSQCALVSPTSCPATKRESN